MRKISILAAISAFALLVGASGAAIAHGQEIPNAPNNKVTVDIRNLKSHTIDRNNNLDEVENSGSADNSNQVLAQNTNGNTNGNTSASTSADTNDNGASASVTAADSSVAAGGSGSAGSDAEAASGAAPIFLDTGDDVCMGSGGLGVQSVDVGVSLGSTWRDENCVMLKNARELKNQGYDKAAKARLCMNEDNALAFELAGEPCPRALPSTQAALERIRAWNPGYQTAAAAPVQLAMRDGGAGAPQVAILPPAAEDGAEWATGGFGGFLKVIKAFFQAAADAGAADAGAGPWQSPFDMPE